MKKTFQFNFIKKTKGLRRNILDISVITPPQETPLYSMPRKKKYRETSPFFFGVG